MVFYCGLIIILWPHYFRIFELLVIHFVLFIFKELNILAIAKPTLAVILQKFQKILGAITALIIGNNKSGQLKLTGILELS